MKFYSRLRQKTLQLRQKFLRSSRLYHTQTLKNKIQDLKNAQSDFFYTDNPRLSIIVQFFNKKHNIKKLIERLRITSAEEFIIIDDGSADGSYEEWLKYLDRPNDFLLRCNDIFEVRTYDRAMRMAKGEFVCLLQDDDFPPANNDWIDKALTLFQVFPDLLILGGRDGLDLMMPDPVESPEEQNYRQIGDIIECPGLRKLKIHSSTRYLEPTSNIDFMFTMVVNRAPTFIRRKEFLEIGGINQNYAPFQFDDDDACVRAWLAGYKVGLYSPSFDRGFDVGGMSLFNSEQRKVQSIVNAKRFYKEYSQYLQDNYLKNLVNQANKVLKHQSKRL